MVGSRAFRTRLFGLWLPLIFFVVVTLFPFYWMLITSVKPNAELYNARLFPMIVRQPTLIALHRAADQDGVPPVDHQHADRRHRQPR